MTELFDEEKRFASECEAEIQAQGDSASFKEKSASWFAEANAFKYSYHFSWMGQPIIQYPQDIVALHEIIWQTKPDFIIETGIAHGGSVVFSASQLAVLDLCEPIDYQRKTIAVDIDIRRHNKIRLDEHPLAGYFDLKQGSSIDAAVVAQVAQAIPQGAHNGMVILDSNHTHEHVLEELRQYWKFVGVGNYMVVFDTIIENLSQDWPGREWGPGNSPMTAVDAFLEENGCFVIDEAVDNKLMLSVGPRGFLRRVK